jgi:hypothetical protein
VLLLAAAALQTHHNSRWFQQELVMAELLLLLLLPPPAAPHAPTLQPAFLQSSALLLAIEASAHIQHAMLKLLHPPQHHRCLPKVTHTSQATTRVPTSGCSAHEEHFFLTLFFYGSDPSLVQQLSLASCCCCLHLPHTSPIIFHPSSW